MTISWARPVSLTVPPGIGIENGAPGLELRADHGVAGQELTSGSSAATTLTPALPAKAAQGATRSAGPVTRSPAASHWRSGRSMASRSSATALRRRSRPETAAAHRPARRQAVPRARRPCSSIGQRAPCRAPSAPLRGQLLGMPASRAASLRLESLPRLPRPRQNPRREPLRAARRPLPRRRLAAARSWCSESPARSAMARRAE